MRADRLLSLLMLLQSNGRMTANDLARELEVSERTIYRDINALGTAGVPVYTERGPGGGCALIDNYRTNLTGLNQQEVRALFMLSIPSPLDELGVSQELRGALRKLSAALPNRQRQEQQLARQRFHLDSSWWFQSREPAPHLGTIQQALWQDRMLYLTVQLPFNTQVEIMVAPYGLVAKASVWHLVSSHKDRFRVDRVSGVLDASPAGESFERPVDFDLASFWENWCTDYETNRSSYPTIVRVSPVIIPTLRHQFGNCLDDLIADADQPDEKGRLTLTLPFETLEQARERLLTFGGAVEVLAPVPLRKSIMDFAHQILSRYPASSTK